MLYNTLHTSPHQASPLRSRASLGHYHPEQIPSKSRPNFQFLKLDISVAAGWPGAGLGLPGHCGHQPVNSVTYQPLVHTLSLPCTQSSVMLTPCVPVKCNINTLYSGARCCTAPPGTPRGATTSATTRPACASTTRTTGTQGILGMVVKNIWTGA